MLSTGREGIGTVDIDEDGTMEEHDISMLGLLFFIQVSTSSICSPWLSFIWDVLEKLQPFAFCAVY